jgi:transcriptional regulator GlxA family with amidase domain
MEAVRRIRLQRAKELGMTTALPVKVIAARVGIPDPAHFSRLFRKQFGLSMRQLRAH